MKKIIIIFALLSLSVFAETVKVDFDYIISNHPAFENVKNELEKEKIKLQEILDLKQNELNMEESVLQSKADNVTEEEAIAFYKKEQELQNLFAQAQSNLSSLKNQKMQGLYSDILKSIDIVYKNKEYDAIIDSQAIIVGNDKIKDISEDIIKSLKNTEKIELF